MDDECTKESIKFGQKNVPTKNIDSDMASNQRDGEQTTETLRETADEELFVDICYLADDVKNTNR